MAVLPGLALSSAQSLSSVRYTALIEREVGQRDWNYDRVCRVDALQVFSVLYV
jgi:hypothetical protein